MMQVREEVRHFAERMEKKLGTNDHKPHWRDMSPVYLMARLREEVDELEAALFDNFTAEEKADEAADVANFAMMLSDWFTEPCERTRRIDDDHSSAEDDKDRG